MEAPTLATVTDPWVVVGGVAAVVAPVVMLYEVWRRRQTRLELLGAGNDGIEVELENRSFPYFAFERRPSGEIPSLDDDSFVDWAFRHGGALVKQANFGFKVTCQGPGPVEVSTPRVRLGKAFRPTFVLEVGGVGGNGAPGLYVRADLDQTSNGEVHVECYSERFDVEGMAQLGPWEGSSRLRTSDILPFFVVAEARSVACHFEVHIPWMGPGQSGCKRVADRRFIVAGPEALQDAACLYWNDDLGTWSEERPYWARQ